MAKFPITVRCVWILVAAVVPLFFGCQPGPSAEPEIENVIIVLVDTLRADHLGAWGHTRETSPALDALVAESARQIAQQ